MPATRLPHGGLGRINETVSELCCGLLGDSHYVSGIISTSQGSFLPTPHLIATYALLGLLQKFLLKEEWTGAAGVGGGGVSNPGWVLP